MKVSVFNLMSYLADDLPAGWPTPPRYSEPRGAIDSIRRGWDLWDIAVESGFDWLTVSEHHYSPGIQMPNPIVMGAALAARYSEPRIAVLGPLLPLHNPVKIAEELAMLDNLSEGRLIAGMLRGIPNELMTYGTNPAESMPKFEEALELILRAWTEPEPFGWEGVHYRFRTVSVWPRPVQRPAPPLLGSGLNPDSAAWCARHRMMLGLSFLAGPEKSAELVSIYRAAAEEAGWNPTADEIVYRARIYVGETDEQAEQDARTYDLGNVLGKMIPPPERQAANQAIFIELAGGSGFRHHPPGPGSLPEYYGSPDTVARQLRDASKQIGYGVADLIFKNDFLPYEKAKRSLELFGKEVLPQLRAH